LAVLKGLGEPAEELLAALKKHSLVREETPEELAGETRLNVYESFRLFAQRKLRRSPDAANARAAFETAVLDHVLALWKRDQKVGSQTARERIQFELPALLEILHATGNPANRSWATILAAPILHANGERARAVELLRDALEGINPARSEAVWLKLTDCALRVQDAPEDVAAMLEDVQGEAHVRFNALYTRASALHAMGRTEEAIELIRQASALQGLSNSKHAMLKSRLALLYADSGRTREARNLFEAALQLARGEDVQLLVSRILYHVGWLNVTSDRVADGVAQLTEALEIAEYEGDRTLEATTAGGLALGLHLKGEKQKAEACALRGIRMCRELGRSLTECEQHGTLSRIYLEQGRKDDALQAATRGRDLAREIGSKRSEALAEGSIAAARMARGEEAEALQAWQASFRLLGETNDKRGALSALGNIGVLQAAQWRNARNPRDLRMAIETLARVVRERQEQGYDPLIDLELTHAELLIDADRQSEARDALVSTLATASARSDELGRHVGEKSAALLKLLDARTPLQGLRSGGSPGSGRQNTVNGPAVMTPPPARTTSPSSGDFAVVPPKDSNTTRKQHPKNDTPGPREPGKQPSRKPPDSH
jgi:tetratricopeptide (TPR) repeat protein